MVGTTRTRCLVGCAALFAASVLACGHLLPGDLDATTSTEPGDPAPAKGIMLAGLDGAAADGPVQSQSQPSDAGAAVDAVADVGANNLIVFVTSAVYRVSDLGGLDGADAKCNERAAAGTAVVRNRTYRAWISGGDHPMKDVLGDTDGPWARPDGVVVATSKSHLLGNQPLGAAISVDENGWSDGGPVWTGTDADGSAANVGTCNDFGTNVNNGQTAIGTPVKDKPGWTHSYSDICGSDWAGSRHYKLYCFEVVVKNGN